MVHKDIKTGKQILNKAMKGNPFRQLSLLRQGVEMNSFLIKELYQHLGIENNLVYQSYKPLMDKLELENQRILEILIQEYPEEFEEVED